ncbi:glycoside hydrolase family 95 protein, partial [Paenibacillus sepulcri]|nr:glycoside hydrolase family 95 protein [Paenibacillus sepulcri]
EGRDPGIRCSRWLDAAAQLSYAELRSRHIREHRRYYDRADLTLDAPGRSDLPTDERIKALRAGGADEQLAALFFRYGRYLLIASSRPGTQAAT